MYKVQKIYAYPMFFWISIISLTIGIKISDDGTEMLYFGCAGALIFGLLTLWWYNEINEPQSTFWFVSIIFILIELYLIYLLFF